MRKINLVVLVLVAMFAAVSAQASTYVVKRGETLGAIACKNHVTVSQIAKANGIRNINRISVGQVLQIPERVAAKTQIRKSATFAKASATEKLETKVAAKEEVTDSSASTEKSETTAVAKKEEVVETSNDQSRADSSAPWNEDVVAVEKELQAKQSEENLKIASKKKMSASRQYVPVPDTGKTEARTSEEGTHSFAELSATIGGWKASKTKGVYSLFEGIKWFGNENGDQNIGIGGVLQLDKGWGQNSTSWGFVAPGIELGYWKNLNDKVYVLVKPRISYRINQTNQWHDKPNQGIMLGGYGEVTRVFSARDLGIIAADGNYFVHDSYASVRAYWEHMVSNDWKIKVGVGPVAHFSKDESSFGISPALIAKYNDTISVGITADTSKGGPFYGAFVTYEYNSDRHNPLNIKK